MASPYGLNQIESVCHAEPCVEAREAAVPGAIRSLGFARERLAKIAAELEGRLAPVLRTDDRPKGDTGANRTPYCALESVLQVELFGLEAAEAVLLGILHRLEI